MRIIVFLCLSFLCFGCTSSSGITDNDPAAYPLGTGAINARLDWGSSAKAAVKAVSSAPAGVATVRIIIAGTGMTQAVQKDFAVAAGSGTIDGIPAGTGRTVTAQGLDASGAVTYQGTAANITVKAGQVSDAGTITMVAVTTGAFRGTILLGSPTSSSIKASIFSPDQSGTIMLQYGMASGVYDRQTAAAALSAGSPLIATIDGLAADTRYYYRLYFQSGDGGSSGPSAEYSFRTARSSAARFTFTIQADSHLDENSDLDVYRRTLANILADLPDFHIDLGDTFMTEKHSAPLTAVLQTARDQATVNARYIYDRNQFSLITHSVPLFLVNGNHEGEAGWMNTGTAQNLAVWATLARKNYFLNPAPDSFYSGDTVDEPYVGKRASWYAWNWGNALFIVLDPFWNSKTQATRDPWAQTLGDNQYRWLQTTLATSSATFKFVFIHNLVGGLDGQMRGGIEAAPYFEWGGRNPDGSMVFSQKRPGWSMPIHQLLVQYGVTAVFHGHDHVYARQELDGIVYQELPQPSARDSSNGANLAAQYHYTSGAILSSSGHLRVNVDADRVTVQYVRAWLPKDETSKRKNGQIDDSWSVVKP